MKKVDDLNTLSRDFYEHARFKLSLSLMFASFGMMSLGWCSSTGAQAQIFNLYYGISGVTDDQKSMFKQMSSGDGFACFAWLCAAIISFAVALFISPLVASEFEKRILASPSDIEGSQSSQSQPSSVQSQQSSSGVPKPPDSRED